MEDIFKYQSINWLKMELKKRVFLQPGEIYASKGPTIISMTLGSCVSVCLYDFVNQIGGANHFMLPLPYKKTIQQQNRYGEYAIPALIEKMLSFGVKKSDMVAHIIGGGTFLKNSDRTIGIKNARYAREYLEKESIRISKEHVGGKHGRLLRFDTLKNDISITKIEPPYENRKTKFSLSPVSFLNELEYDYLKEIFSLGIGRAAASLAKMVGHYVEIAAPQILLREVDYIDEYLKDLDTPLVSLNQKLTHNISGNILVVFAPQKHRWLLDLVVGNMCKDNFEKDLEEEALKEIGNILGNAFTGTLGDFLEIEVETSAPMLLKRLPTFFWNKFFASDDGLYLLDKSSKRYGLTIKTNLGIRKLKQKSTFLMILPLSSLYLLFQNLKSGICFTA